MRTKMMMRMPRMPRTMTMPWTMMMPQMMAFMLRITMKRRTMMLMIQQSKRIRKLRNGREMTMIAVMMK